MQYQRLMNKYTKWHDALVQKIRDEGNDRQYNEIHHILPRCLGGSDLPDNLLRVTHKEHFILHLLLTKIYPDCDRLWFAYAAMCGGSNGLTPRPRANSRHFDNLRRYTFTKYQEGKIAYHHITSKKVVWLLPLDVIPDYLVRGMPSELIQLNSLKRKGAKSYYHPVTFHQIKIYKDDDREIPDGYIEGISPTIVASTGRIWCNNGIKNLRVLTTHDVPNGYKLGRVSIGKWYTNGARDIQVQNDTTIPDGFYPGRKKGLKIGYKKGSRWVSNGVDDIMISPDDVIPEGYRLGRARGLSGFDDHNYPNGKSLISTSK